MKILKVLVGIVVLWLVALVVFDFVGAGKIERRVIARVGDPLGATVTIGKSDLALIRGHLDLDKLAIKKSDGGELSIDIDNIRCDLPPLGVALIDGDCNLLSIKTMRVAVSAIGAFKLHNASSPVHAKAVVIDDAVLELSPSALVSALGKVTITVEHAEAKDTVFKTPLSWIFALVELRAKVDLPGGTTIVLGYKNGKLSVSGGLLGSKPVELPFEIPVANLADDPKAELERIVKLVKDTGEKLVEQKAQDFLKSLHP